MSKCPSPSSLLNQDVAVVVIVVVHVHAGQCGHRLRQSPRDAVIFTVTHTLLFSRWFRPLRPCSDPDHFFPVTVTVGDAQLSFPSTCFSNSRCCAPRCAQIFQCNSKLRSSCIGPLCLSRFMLACITSPALFNHHHHFKSTCSPCLHSKRVQGQVIKACLPSSRKSTQM